MDGNRLKRSRKNLGLTQGELGSKLGVIKQTVSNWENNISEPNQDTLIKLSQIFNCSVDYLLGRTDETNGYSNNQINHSNNVALGKNAQVNVGNPEGPKNMNEEILTEVSNILTGMTLQEKAEFINYLYKFKNGKTEN